MPHTERLDQLLVARDLVDSRNKAQALILAGKVWVNDQVVHKAGQKFSADVSIEINSGIPYVGRGGLKLAAALEEFQDQLQIAGLPEPRVALDIGASTGGFTDCLLQNGFQRVYAVDVGYNQLDYRLRQDKRVIVLERQNVRKLEAEKIPESVDLIVVDVSFISVLKFIERLPQFLKPEGKILVLVKPQFEAERSEVGKGGIIRDDNLRQEIFDRWVAAVENQKFRVLGKMVSPITGAKGNQEFFCLMGSPDL